MERGEIYKLGKHRLMCGDSLSLIDVKTLMNHKKAIMMFTDPPYNVDYKREGHSWKYGYKSKIQNFKDTDFEIDKFLKLLEMEFIEGACYICCGTAQIGKYVNWSQKFLKRNPHIIIWLKPNFSLIRGDYNRRYEQIMYLWFDKKKWRGEKSKSNSDVWYIQGRNVSKYIHPTQKPLMLIIKAIENNSDKEDIVLDLFGGSGSTLIACEKTNRICYMMEIMPEYCEKIIQRYEKLTNKKAEKQ